jgi:hypothetical protein
MREKRDSWKVVERGQKENGRLWVVGIQKNIGKKEKESKNGEERVRRLGGGDREAGANYFQNPDARGRVLSFSLLVIDNIV